MTKFYFRLQIVSVASLSLVVSGSGCRYDRSLSDRMVLGGMFPIAGLGTLDGPEDALDPGVPLRSMHRGEWSTMDVIVPVDGTVHGPLWRVDRRFAFRSPRSKGLYPTLESALDLRESKRVGLVVEGFVSPLLAAGSTVALPIVIVADTPGTQASPSSRTLYKRAPQGRAMLGSLSGGQPGDSTSPE